MSQTMKCDEVAPLLDEYASDELPRSLREAVDAHLGGCANCQAALERFLALDARIRALPMPAAPPEIAVQLRIRLAGERPGIDPAATAPSGWLGDHATPWTPDEPTLRLVELAA